MQKHTKVALKSRWLDKMDWIPCEVCWNTAVDAHHIQGRLWKLYDDPYNLIWLCRECHYWIHQHNTDDIKKQLLDIVKKILW